MGGPPHIHATLSADCLADDVPLLLVDGHHLLWAGTFGFPAAILSKDRQRDLTGLFAFFAMLRVAVRNDIPGRPEIIVVFDGEHGSLQRQTVHSGYKSSRPGDTQARRPLQFLAPIKTGLTQLGLSWLELDHAEADDVIATIVQRTDHRRRVIISSGDKDYYQLISGDRVTVHNSRLRAGARLINAAEVYRRHQVTPRQWADFRALTGDPADEIPGVTGIGAVTAARLLDGGLTIDDLPASGHLSHGRGKAVTAQWEQALRWRDMIRLDTTLALPIWPTGQPSRDLPAPAQVVEALGMW